LQFVYLLSTDDFAVYPSRRCSGSRPLAFLTLKSIYLPA
jgi:hypothetical protein